MNIYFTNYRNMSTNTQNGKQGKYSFIFYDFQVMGHPITLYFCINLYILLLFFSHVFVEVRAVCMDYSSSYISLTLPTRGSFPLTFVTFHRPFVGFSSKWRHLGSIWTSECHNGKALSSLSTRRIGPQQWSPASRVTDTNL